MIIKQDLIDSSKYSLKCPYSMSPIGICVHNTANNASAKNEISYMKSNNSSTSFHIAVDNVEAIQGIPFNRNTWHSGDGTNGVGNRNYISIEICYSTGNLDTFKKAEENAVKVIVQLLKQYGWDIGKVKKHQDFSGKYCPHKTLDLGWDRFINLIKAELNNSNTTQNNVSSNDELYRVRLDWNNASSQIGAYKDLNNAINACKSGYKVYNSKGEQVYPVVSSSATTSKEYAENGSAKVIVNSLNVRDNHSLNSNVVANYTYGETFTYNYVKIVDNRVWVRYTSYTGNVRWVCVKENGTRYANCY